VDCLNAIIETGQSMPGNHGASERHETTLTYSPEMNVTLEPSEPAFNLPEDQALALK